MYLCISIIILIISTSESIDHRFRQFSPSVRIIGGKEVDISEYPYQVSLEYYGDHKCGGALLDNFTVITAAHCTYDIGAGAFKIRAGTSTLGNGGALVAVKSKFEHPDFDHWTYDNDIAVLKLREPVIFTDKIKSIIPAKGDYNPVTDSIAAVSGWGSRSATNSSLSQRLRAVNVSIVDSGICSQAYVKILPITEHMFCAGGSGEDACHGDSGGPLVQNNTLIGVVSWGKGCGDSSYYGVHTKVSKYHQYISKFIDHA